MGLDEYEYRTFSKKLPDARGVFCGGEGKLHIRCNGREHMEFISREDGHDVEAAFTRYAESVKACEKVLTERGKMFMFNDRLGFLASSFADVGAGMSASAVISMPKTLEQVRA